MNSPIQSKQKLATKAARGLIGSNLTTQELEQVANEIINNEEFIQNLSSTILRFLHAEQEAPYQTSKTLGVYIDFLTLVKRKRLSKSEFVNAISQFNEKAAKRLNPNQMTMDEIVLAYQGLATPEEQTAVYNFISLGKSTDPYLSKILDRRR